MGRECTAGAACCVPLLTLLQQNVSKGEGLVCVPVPRLHYHQRHQTSVSGDSTLVPDGPGSGVCLKQQVLSGIMCVFTLNAASWHGKSSGNNHLQYSLVRKCNTVSVIIKYPNGSHISGQRGVRQFYICAQGNGEILLTFSSGVV